MSQYLSEAFKRLDSLNEETFSISNDGLEDFAKFQEEDKFEDIIDVIDVEAETIDDIQDSYIGKVILDCCICHSKIYKDVEDVILDGDIANSNEECPFCCTTDGFKVVGQVAEFGEDETDDKDTEDDESETTDDKLEEGLFSSTSVLMHKQGNVWEPIATGEHTAKFNQFRDAYIHKYGGETSDFKIVSEKDANKLSKVYKNRKKSLPNVDKSMPSWAKSFDKKAVDAEKERQRGAEVAKRWGEVEANERKAKRDYERERYNSLKGSNVSNTGKAGIHYSGGDYYSESIKESVHSQWFAYETKPRDFKGKFKKFTDEKEAIQFAKENGWKCVARYDDNGSTSDKVDAEETIVYQESLKESVNNVNVETDEDVINVATDDSGKVTVTTEPKTTDSDIEGEEVITPLEPETQSEISDNVGDGEEIEIDMEEFDEESFDTLGEGYLKKVYENVDSFKTSNVSFIKDKLILEGVIKFNSGNSKKTNFIFGIREATKSGKVRFIGENKEIARGRKSFTVTGRVEDKKFLSESFNYNYGVRNSQGKAQRLYGTIKNTK